MSTHRAPRRSLIAALTGLAVLLTGLTLLPGTKPGGC